MATAAAYPPVTGGKIKLEYGIGRLVSFKFLQGKNVEGLYGPQVLFTCEDDARLYLDCEDGSDVERQLADLGVQRNEGVILTKIRHPRGGGHSRRVARAEPNEDAKFVEQLRGSDRACPAAEGRTGGSENLAADAAPAIAETPKPAIQTHTNTAAPATPEAAGMMAAMCAAVDAIIETHAYAQRRGLGVTFSEESVRAIGLSIYIGQQRAGAR